MNRAGTTTNGSARWALLPPELLEMQLGQIDLLMAMYPSEQETIITDETRALVDKVRQICEGQNNDGTQHLAELLTNQNQRHVFLDLKLALEGQDGSSGSPAAPHVDLEIAVPLGFVAEEQPAEPPRIKTRMRQPAWTSRSETAAINSGIPTEDEDLLGVIEYIREAASRAWHAQSANSSSTSSTTQPSGEIGALRAKGSSSSYSPTTNQKEPLVRVWFYFPSISTRSKRDDLVQNAPAYGLTGFLLAGKPGLLCLEGGSRAVDEYMRFIKTESWGDIPAHHKKVSERYREESGGDGQGEEVGNGGSNTLVRRVFTDMAEITDTVGGERRGERANRGDMKAIEAWLTDRGLGTAFTKVLI